MYPGLGLDALPERRMVMNAEKKGEITKHGRRRTFRRWFSATADRYDLGDGRSVEEI